MIPSLWVLGTDTGVGKTRVASLLCLLGSDQGPLGACKPVATGASRVMGELVSPDTEALKAAAGSRQSSREITPFLFEPPLAAWTSAQASGTTLKAAAVAEAVRHVAKLRGRVIAEGAGGVLLPLNETETLLDAVAASGLPVILVAALRLGCINHALLSLEACAARRISVEGVMLNSASGEVNESLKDSALGEIRSRHHQVAWLPHAPSLPAALGPMQTALVNLGWVSP